MNKLALLIGGGGGEDESGEIKQKENCFVCKHDQDLYVRAKEKNRLITCTNCKEESHATCYNLAIISDLNIMHFTCLPCRILLNQPDLNEFESVLGPILLDGKEKVHDKIHFSLSENQAQRISSNTFYELAVYCTKIDMFQSQGKYQYYSWPSDNIVIKLNDKIQSYQLDQVCRLAKQDLKFYQTNTLSYYLGDINSYDSKFITIGIAFVKLGNAHQVLEKIILRQTASEEDNKKQYKEWSKEIEISFPMKDQITQTLIKWPARGRNCSHFTCIDLYSYLEFNLQNSSLEKSRWSCPTCQQRLYVKDLLFDKYLYHFMKNEILKKIESEFLSLVEEVTCDQNGQLRICDESVQKIEQARLRKLLREENVRIEQEITKKRKLYSENMNQELNEKLNTPLTVNVSRDKEEAIHNFNTIHSEINPQNVESIFEEERELICSLDPLQLVCCIMDCHPSLRQLCKAVDKASLEKCSSLFDLMNLMKEYCAHNQTAFKFVRMYADALCDGQESKYAARVAVCLTLLTKNEKRQYVTVENIATEFIILALQFALNDDSINPIQIGLLVGQICYFFVITMRVSFEGIIQFFSTMINLTGTVNPLSQMEDAVDFIADVLYSFISLWQNSAAQFDQVLFFQKLLLKQVHSLIPQKSPQALNKQVALFKIITSVLYSQDPRSKLNKFKIPKEFILNFVEKNTDIISHLKTIADRIF